MGRSQSLPYRMPTSRAVDPLTAIFPAAGAFFMVAVLTAWATTEYVASAFGFNPALGTQIAPRIYSPFAFVAWTIRFANYAPARTILTHELFILGGGLLLGAGLAGFVLLRRANQARNSSADLHGSAHFATPAEVQRTGLLGRKVDGKLKTGGVYVGAWSPDNRPPRYLRHDGPEHVLAFAPTRSGKGVGLVLPTLNSWPHSVVVHDIKGENWELSAGWRKEALGSVCIKFEPTNGDGTSARFNPLDEVRIGTDSEVPDAQNIASMIVDPDGKGLGDHWAKTSFALLVGTILHVLYAEDDKSLRGVAAYLSDPMWDHVDQMFENMINAKHDVATDRRGRPVEGFVDKRSYAKSTHSVIAQSAQDMLNKAENEKSGVLSTALSFLTLYRDPVVAANTERSDFSIRDLMHHERPVSLYLVVPPSDKDRLRPLIRLMLNQIVRTLAARMEFADGKTLKSYNHRLLLMLDEFPSLGKLEVLQESLAFLAGYGIKTYLITQDLSQLWAAYSKDESIVSNCHIRIAYAPNKVETAKYLSEMCGEMTVTTESRSYSGSRMQMMMQATSTQQEIKRPLLSPDEAMRLRDRDALIFVAGNPPIFGRKIQYYDSARGQFVGDPTFQRRAKVTAPVESDRPALSRLSAATAVPPSVANGAAENGEAAGVKWEKETVA